MASELSDGLNYFLIFFFFAMIIILVFCIIAFAKWLTWGPSWKRKWNKLIGKSSSKKGQEGVKVKGKEIIVDESYIIEIDEKIKKAETPQELLEHQISKEKHEKQKIKAENEIQEKENLKLEKLESKDNKKRLKQEAKVMNSELKQKNKENKKELKEQKNKNKSEKEGS